MPTPYIHFTICTTTLTSHWNHNNCNSPTRHNQAKHNRTQYSHQDFAHSLVTPSSSQYTYPDNIHHVAHILHFSSTDNLGEINRHHWHWFTHRQIEDSWQELSILPVVVAAATATAMNPAFLCASTTNTHKHTLTHIESDRQSHTHSWQCISRRECHWVDRYNESMSGWVSEWVSGAVKQSSSGSANTDGLHKLVCVCVFTYEINDWLHDCLTGIEDILCVMTGVSPEWG